MNRILTILLVFFCICYGSAQTKQKIAIFDPTTVSISLEYGTKDAIRELISSTVVNSKRYNVLERAMLEKILQEQEFSHSSMVDDKDAVAIGKLAGAEKVLVSVLASSSGKLLFTVKLLNLETSDIEYQQFCYANDMGDLFEKIEPTVSKLFECEIGIYEGERKDGRPHGQGVMEYKNGDVYRGEWKNGVRHGWGYMKQKYNSWIFELYEGDWQNNAEHGNGFKRYHNGNEYNGEWKHGKESGKGVLVYKNGNRFEGEFVNGEPSHGTLKYSNGNKFEGEFKQGCPFFGTLKFPNGDIYQGDFADCYDGRIGSDKGNAGVKTYANGSKFEGTFYYGNLAPVGYCAYVRNYQYGTMTYANRDRYEGRLIEEKKDAHEATMYYFNGDIYKGEWDEDKREGRGVMKWSDGSIYEGRWKEDKREGSGVMRWSDGTVYDGSWKDDMMHGEGTIISPKGIKRKGYWYYGTKQKKKKH